MNYKKQNFKNGTVLRAENLNQIEDGIKQREPLIARLNMENEPCLENTSFSEIFEHAKTGGPVLLWVHHEDLYLPPVSICEYGVIFKGEKIYGKTVTVTINQDEEIYIDIRNENENENENSIQLTLTVNWESAPCLEYYTYSQVCSYIQNGGIVRLLINGRYITMTDYVEEGPIRFTYFDADNQSCKAYVWELRQDGTFVEHVASFGETPTSGQEEV